MDEKPIEIECDDFAENSNQSQEVPDEEKLYYNVVRSSLEHKIPALVLKPSNENLTSEQCLIGDNGLQEQPKDF